MTDALTREKIAELRKLCAAATPGPWRVDSHDEEDGSKSFAIYADHPFKWLFELNDSDDEPEDRILARTLAPLIVAAVNTLPALLDLAASLSAGEGSGMETTAEERAKWAAEADKLLWETMEGPYSVVCVLLRDINRLLALSAKAREEENEVCKAIASAYSVRGEFGECAQHVARRIYDDIAARSKPWTDPPVCPHGTIVGAPCVRCLGQVAIAPVPPDREALAELKKLVRWRVMVRAEVSHAHDVPPSYDSEPLLFHQGWEACARYIMKVIG